MSNGKYSPTLTFKMAQRPYTDFEYNCYKQIPTFWPGRGHGIEFDEKTMFSNYDSEGYDSYGYSAFDAEGNYVGIGNGVDRNGYTEYDYMTMTNEEFCNL